MKPDTRGISSVSINGVRIDNVTRASALRTAMECTQQPCVVMTPNAVMLESCRQDRKYVDLLNSASLSLPDGAGVMMAARRKGTPLSERVAGISFGEDVLAYAQKNHLRVFLLGGADGVAKQAAERLCQRFPTLNICGTYWGYFQKDGAENLRLRSYLHICRPDVLLVCFGFPQQEEWIVDNMDVLSSVRVVAALGGSLDVWAQKRRRAPVSVQRCGMEWAWRMAQDPAKLRAFPSLVRFFIHNC